MRLALWYHRKVGFAAMICASVGTGACASAPRAGEREVCVGSEVLIVRNDSGRELDIYEVRGSSQTLLGTVGPGPTELGLTPASDARRYFVARSGSQWLNASRSGSRWTYQVL